MIRKRGIRIAAAAVALAGAGLVLAPAQAARWDPVQQRWIIECGKAPAYDPNQSRSGWQPFAGAANGSGNWYGVRSADPYYVAYVDPSTQKAAVYVWQPWYGEDDIGPGGVFKGPFMVDMSVMVDRNGVHYCEKNYRVPPTKQPLPKPPVTVPPRIPPSR